MAAFEYLAVDGKGRSLSGVVHAANENAARATLEKRRLVPMRLVQGSAKSSTAKPAAAARVPAFRKDHLGTATLSLITRQLATLIRVVPLDEALRSIAMQIDRGNARRILLSVHDSIAEGYRLSDAMAREGRAFPPLYRAMVAAGESSSALPEILERLAALLEREQEVRGKLLTTLIYPAALTVISILVVTALMVFVVPKVVEQFDSMGQALPFLTRAVIAVSDFLVGWGWLLLIALGLLAVLAVRALRGPATRLAFDRFLLRLPFIGRLIRDLNAARLARTLSTMVASGMPLLEGLALTARTVRNTALAQATETMAAGVREGGSLSAAMRRADVFPPLLVHMTASGESSGRLSEMLSGAADYLEREFNTVTSVALSLLEPAIIIVMGGVVATIVLSILLPILQINTLTLG